MKKQVKMMLFVITLMIVGFIGIGSVDAASYTVSEPSKSCTSYKYKSSYHKNYLYVSGRVDATPTILFDKSKKKMLYCIEDGKHLRYKTYDYGSSTKAKLTATAVESTKYGYITYGYITAAIAYGDNDNTISALTTCDTTRIATVTLTKMIGKNKQCSGSACWKGFDASEFAKFFSNSTIGKKVGNKMWDIVQKIKTHSKMPSFGGAASTSKATAQKNAKILSYSASAGKFTATFTDNVLELENSSKTSLWNWSIASKDTGVTASIAGSKKGYLKVSIPTSYAGKTLCVRIKKPVKTGALYVANTSDQKTAVFVNEKDDAAYRYVCFKTDYLKVQKQDAETGKALSGAQYRLYTDNKCTKEATNHRGTGYGAKKTGSDGFAYFYNTGMKQSTYYVKEVTPPEGYLEAPAAEKCKAVKPNNSTAIVYKNEKKGKYDVLVRKINGYTEEGMDEVKIGLFTDATCSTQASVDNPVQTTSSGQAVWKNIVGSEANPTKYYVKEMETPSGFTTKTGKIECQPIEIGQDNEYKTATIYNYPYGNIKILKKDGYTGKVIKGITFTLLDKDKKEVKDINGNVVKPATTDENGVVEFKNIRYGDYYLVEKNDNPAYKVNKDPYEFTLNENTDSIKIKNRGAQEFTYGDVNLDGSINTEDLTLLQSLIKEETVTGVDIVSKYASDIDKSGSDPDEKDAKYLEFYLKYVEAHPDVSFSSAYKEFTTAKLALCTKIGNSECKLNSSVVAAINSIYEANKEQSDINTKMAKVQSTDATDNAESSGESTSEDVKYALGDVNKDGSITQADVDALKGLIGKDATGNELADINSDGKIDATDQEGLEGYLLYKEKGAFTELTNYINSGANILGSDSSITEDELAVINNIGTKGKVPKDIAESSVLIENMPIDMKISKKDITSGDEVSGAKIVIKDSKGKTFLSYTSDGEVKHFYIPAGKYTLTEKVAPKGYVPLTNVVSFQVYQDGTVKLLGSKSKFYKVVKSNEENDTDYDHLIIYNSLKEKTIHVPNTGSNVLITTILLGVAFIGGGSYLIYRRYKMN